MIVVSDTSPISNLIAIDELDLLQSVFMNVIIPTAVKSELETVESYKAILTASQWIVTEKIEDQNLRKELLSILDEGESEAIILAIEKQADFLLIDERKGRFIAAKYGLKITGLLGVLTIAKKKGIIEKVKPYMDKLILISGFRIGKELRDQILMDLKEL